MHSWYTLHSPMCPHTDVGHLPHDGKGRVVVLQVTTVFCKGTDTTSHPHMTWSLPSHLPPSLHPLFLPPPSTLPTSYVSPSLTPSLHHLVTSSPSCTHSSRTLTSNLDHLLNDLHPPLQAGLGHNRGHDPEGFHTCHLLTSCVMMQ